MAAIQEEPSRAKIANASDSRIVFAILSYSGEFRGRRPGARGIWNRQYISGGQFWEILCRLWRSLHRDGARMGLAG